MSTPEYGGRGNRQGSITARERRGDTRSRKTTASMAIERKALWKRCKLASDSTTDKRTKLMRDPSAPIDMDTPFKPNE